MQQKHCNLCDNGIDQNQLLQALIDAKDEETEKIDYLHAKRAYVQEELGLEDVTLSNLKIHISDHIQVVQDE